MDTANDQNPVFRLDLADNFTDKLPPAGIDLTRLQRASKGSNQSAAGGRYDIVKCCGMGRKVNRADAIVFSDCAMYAEMNRLLFGR